MAGIVATLAADRMTPARPGSYDCTASCHEHAAGLTPVPGQKQPDVPGTLPETAGPA